MHSKYKKIAFTNLLNVDILYKSPPMSLHILLWDFTQYIQLKGAWLGFNLNVYIYNICCLLVPINLTAYSFWKYPVASLQTVLVIREICQDNLGFSYFQKLFKQIFSKTCDEHLKLSFLKNLKFNLTFAKIISFKL